MVIISDVTLRDGMHLLNHETSMKFIDEYSKFANSAKIDVLEFGNGFSIGATHPKKMNIDEVEAIKLIKSNLTFTRLSVHYNPHLTPISYLMKIKYYVDIIRIACVPSEIEDMKKYIDAFSDKEIWLSIMYSSSVSYEELVEKCNSVNVDTVVIFDSAGTYVPTDKIIQNIKDDISHKRVGFHGHNNLQLAVANSLIGKFDIVDVSMKGIGAGAGNTPLEIFVNLCKNNSNNETIIEYAENFPYNVTRSVTHVINALKNISPLHSNE